jgi:hypothetical protein
VRRRPYAEMHTALDELGTNRESALHARGHARKRCSARAT